MKRIRFNDTHVADLKDFKAHFYIQKSGGRGYNALLVDCVTRHYKTRLTGAERMYLVIEGEGVFTINGKKTTAAPHDFFIIEDGDTYEYAGEMKLFEFNVPATDGSNEEKLD